jgi:hypothetical protein
MSVRFSLSSGGIIMSVRSDCYGMVLLCPFVSVCYGMVLLYPFVSICSTTRQTEPNGHNNTNP